MNTPRDQAMEELIAQQLGKLPEKTAPSRLLANVMRRVEEQRKLEAAVSEVLHSLPERQAPTGLLPRVIEMIRRWEARPWWQRSWESWPGLVQLGVLCAACVSAGVLLGGASATLEFLLPTPISVLVQQTADWLRPGLGAMRTVLEALVLVLQKSGPLVWACIGVFFALMYGTCLGLSAVCFRLVNARPQLEAR